MKKKHYMGITRMVCVYESSFRHDTKSLESELIRRLKEVRQDPRSLNTGPGGEGRPPYANKKNFLYFAFTHGQNDIVF